MPAARVRETSKIPCVTVKRGESRLLAIHRIRSATIMYPIMDILYIVVTYGHSDVVFGKKIA
ncbi:hypothetical protein BDGGKGIB_00099 [Nodularia sphaerocarpa UHCC 0038]|nr:hypothetical protein BDGGKGIB_00099 [Nodularia sphaerocarpa UHCC 0038]